MPSTFAMGTFRERGLSGVVIRHVVSIQPATLVDSSKILSRSFWFRRDEHLKRNRPLTSPFGSREKVASTVIKRVSPKLRNQSTVRLSGDHIDKVNLANLESSKIEGVCRGLPQMATFRRPSHNNFHNPHTPLSSND
jgi:hypothetical protein